MANNSVYCGAIQQNFDTGESLFQNFEIFTAGRTLKIKSISLDIQIFDNITGKVIDFRDIGACLFYLKVGNNQKVIGKTFNNFVPGAENGICFYLYQPQKIYYNSFFVSETLNFQINFVNIAANLLTVNISLTVETEENINYT